MFHIVFAFPLNKRMTEYAILFVDDEPIMRRLLLRFLSPYFRVFEAESVAGAMEMLQTSHKEINIVVTDMKMPDGSGLTLIDSMAEHFSHIPVIVCTGDLSFCDFDKLIKNNKIAAVIEKPMTGEQAINTINSVLEGNGQTTES